MNADTIALVASVIRECEENRGDRDDFHEWTASRVLAALSRPPEDNPLSACEVRVFRRLQEGLSVKQIARRERVVPSAISNRIARAVRKLGAVTPIQAAMKAQALRLLRDVA